MPVARDSTETYQYRIVDPAAGDALRMTRGTLTVVGRPRRAREKDGERVRVHHGLQLARLHGYVAEVVADVQSARVLYQHDGSVSGAGRCRAYVVRSALV